MKMFHRIPGFVLHCLLNVCVLNCSRVTLVNNGYRNIVIAINPNIQYNKKLIENVKEMMTEASNYLSKATMHQLYYSDVKIVLPATWALKSNVVQRPSTESYEKASVIIAEPYLKQGDTPYTLQYGGCGEKGRYIHFTPNFILNDKMTTIYCPKGRVFVHEWAHLRWGVFDEYNDAVPFYISDSETAEATRCSLSIRGKTAECKGSVCSSCTTDESTGLPNKQCQFFPEKNQRSSSSIMYLQGLPNVDKFCDNKTHNAEAPNMQNRMCNYRSTWDVISKSEDFRNISSPHTGSVEPTFTLLQAKDRVLCLVLDVSGSMGRENRIGRLRQAAEIFLLQIAETGSYAGMVTFNSGASIQTRLKRINNNKAREDLVKLLPTLANGGTNICEGIRSGFEVLRGDDSATQGDEIILLTDGIDHSMGNCFPEVEQSGAVIHTIALGPSAAEELEELSTMTGGLQFAATDDLSTNGLIDSFTGLISGSGDSSQQSIQLESSGTSIGSNRWLNGTVVIDKTIGNDTFFVVNWESVIPTMSVCDPNGNIYNNAYFKIDQSAKSARLMIKGTAQSGTWFYSILNGGGNQVITIIVTSRAADAQVPPIKVNGYISRKDSTSPMIFYVEVSHGFLPVLNAIVTAIIERPNDPPIQLKLSDDGLGADIVKNDGVYSKYFIDFRGKGRYSVKVRVLGIEGTTSVTFRRGGQALCLPGYVENGNIEVNPLKSDISEEDLHNELGDFTRVQAGGSISLPSATPLINFPPSTITDLLATIVKNKIKLEWTAPGGNYDKGSASRYEMRMSDKLLQLRDHFFRALLINTTTIYPQPYGSKETVMIYSEHPNMQNGAAIYFAVRAYDKSNLTSKLSNIARASFFEPLSKSKWWICENQKMWFPILIVVIGCLIVGITVYIVCQKKKKWAPESVPL
ncbi:calcium-activated chloride channel regulator 1-like isoform X1 [Leucoraja erinacea]|uniref:calcium-activated chloride channel regulator 1-like isoform X1 n=1 Tax=Leucoraja erinaceus TaxID=7782 RepID=UPI002454339C|nr:calcium-activated chloride channel regulator 1-like isoform X1 [Leucoraja erinacea]